MAEEKRLFTPAQAADFLTELAGRKISVARVAQLRREGRLKGEKVDYNTVIYTREELIALGYELRRETEARQKDLPNAA